MELEQSGNQRRQALNLELCSAGRRLAGDRVWESKRVLGLVDHPRAPNKLIKVAHRRSAVAEKTVAREIKGAVPTVASEATVNAEEAKPQVGSAGRAPVPQQVLPPNQQT